MSVRPDSLPSLSGFDLRKTFVGTVQRQQIHADVERRVIVLSQPRAQLVLADLDRFDQQNWTMLGDANGGTCQAFKLHALDVHLDQIEPRKVVGVQDRKSTRLNSSHSQISYAVF